MGTGACCWAGSLFNLWKSLTWYDGFKITKFQGMTLKGLTFVIFAPAFVFYHFFQKKLAKFWKFYSDRVQKPSKLTKISSKISLTDRVHLSIFSSMSPSSRSMSPGRNPLAVISKKVLRQVQEKSSSQAIVEAKKWISNLNADWYIFWLDEFSWTYFYTF